MRILLMAVLLTAGAVSPARAQMSQHCADGVCDVKVTPAQMLAAAEKLVAANRFDEALPLIEALKMAPGYSLQTRFLTGYIASQKGDWSKAADQYKAILADDPSQTRVRLELGKAMLAMGKPQSADKQLRLAGQADDLPPELAKAIRGARAVIRQQRAWRFDVDFGIAPDSNINNATAVDTVNVNLGGYTLPLELNPDAKARSGTGQTATISAGLRLPAAPNMSVLVDVDTSGVNYAGTAFDDYLAQAAVGPELRIGQNVSVSLQGVAAQRWFGGRIVSRQVGGKIGGQANLGMSDRIGVQLDTRKTDTRFDPGYDGWQAGLYGTWEHALSKSLVGSLGVFGRRDWLNEHAYSNKEVGVNLGIGGELPLGINFSLSGSASRAKFDAPMQFFSPEPRKDWRYTARATLGNRAIRVFGFSPELSLTYAKVQSNLPFFSTDRVRFKAALARYF